MVFREHFNGMYRTDAFFFAKQVVEMPLYILEATIMFTLIYWIANLNPEAERFFIALGIIILTPRRSVARQLGLLGVASGSGFWECPPNSTLAGSTQCAPRLIPPV